MDCKQGEVRLASKASFHLPGPGFRPVQGGLLSNRGQVPVHSGGYSSSAFQPPYYSTPGYAPFGSTSLLHKQTRGHSLLGHVCPDLAPVCLLLQEQGCSYSKTRSRGHESCDRPTLQVSTDPSYRVVSQSQDLQVVVTNRLPTSDISFCNKIQSQASPVCFSSARSQGSGSRCPGDELVRTSSLLLPSYSSLSTCGQKVNQLSELQDASCGSSLGNQRVASRSIGTVNKKTSRSSSKRKSLKATSSRGVSSKSKESQPSCLLAEVSLEKKRVFSGSD